VLPAPFPNLLVNGSAGIAVGMATNVPPHNLGEVIDGLVWLIEHTQVGGPRRDGPAQLTREQKLKHLIGIIRGPDFPTGGTIVGHAGIVQAFATGRGSITIRARAEFESRRRATAPPSSSARFPTRSTRPSCWRKSLSSSATRSSKASRTCGTSPTRRSPRGHRVEAGRAARGGAQQPVQAHAAADHLRHHHARHRRGRPRVLSLVEMLEQFVEFRRDVVRRRTEFELRKAEARAHILEGLRIALDHLDAVITLIRGSKSPADARVGLVREFGCRRSRPRPSSTCSCSA